VEVGSPCISGSVWRWGHLVFLVVCEAATVLGLGLVFVYVDDLTKVTEVAHDGADKLDTYNQHDGNQFRCLDIQKLWFSIKLKSTFTKRFCIITNTNIRNVKCVFNSYRWVWWV